MSAVVSVYAVFGSDEEADTIARAMIERRLAACVNILGACRSIYRWDGAIAEDPEVAAIFKTSRDLANELIAEIAAMHSYAVPAIALWPIEATLQSYAQWVESETASGS